jgi:cysteine synthase A
LTPAEATIQGAVDRAAELAGQPGVFMPQQFENPDNPRCHFNTTAEEIWEQMEGNVAAFVAGVGSGVTLQGVGDGFIPAVLDVNLVDQVVEVADDDAIGTARVLARRESLLVGTSSGANVWAAMQIAGNIAGNIVTILADRAERYFSTSLI